MTDYELLVRKIKALNPKNEEATKQWLVLPFLQLMGFDIFSDEVTPEYTADITGIKKGEKVDYFLTKDLKPFAVVECKTLGTEFKQEHITQLYRYFVTTEVKLGILTDGNIYMFFTDNKRQNVMDEEPFLEITLTTMSEESFKNFKDRIVGEWITKKSNNYYELYRESYDKAFWHTEVRIKNQGSHVTSLICISENDVRVVQYIKNKITGKFMWYNELSEHEIPEYILKYVEYEREQKKIYDELNIAYLYSRYPDGYRKDDSKMGYSNFMKQLEIEMPYKCFYTVNDFAINQSIEYKTYEEALDEHKKLEALVERKRLEALAEHKKLKAS